ncbi:MAG: tetratricopeptide repeat protein [Acidobacteriota bacterium]
MVSVKAKKGKITVKEMKRDPMWELYEKVTVKLEPYKEKIVYGVIGVVIVIVLGSLITLLMSYMSSRGQEALAKALEIYNSPVAAAGSEALQNKAKKSYTDEQQKYKEAAEAFDKVAADYSSQKEVARYYAALSRSYFDAAKAQTELEELAKSNSDVGFWSKVALAESYAASDKADRAIAIYQQLKDNSGTLPKSLVFYNIGRLYERQKNTAEAIKAYFESASADRSSAEGKKANERLNVLDPATAKKLPPEPDKDNETES